MDLDEETLEALGYGVEARTLPQTPRNLPMFMSGTLAAGSWVNKAEKQTRLPKLTRRVHAALFPTKRKARPTLSEEERKLRKRERNRRYLSTPGGKKARAEATKRYYATPIGRKKKLARNRDYANRMKQDPARSAQRLAKNRENYHKRKAQRELQRTVPPEANP